MIKNTFKSVYFSLAFMLCAALCTIANAQEPALSSNSDNPYAHKSKLFQAGFYSKHHDGVGILVRLGTSEKKLFAERGIANDAIAKKFESDFIGRGVEAKAFTDDSYPGSTTVVSFYIEGSAYDDPDVDNGGYFNMVSAPLAISDVAKLQKTILEKK